MSNSGLNLSFSISTPKPSIQSEDLLHAVNCTLQEYLNEIHSSCYDSTYYNIHKITSQTTNEINPVMQSENLMLCEINAGLWDKAITSAISSLTQKSYPHYMIAQEFFNYIFNVKPNYNFSPIKEFFSKLLLSHPPKSDMNEYYLEILRGKYLILNGKTPEDKGFLLSLIEMLITLLKAPEKCQTETNSIQSQDQQILEVTKNFNEIILSNFSIKTQNKKCLTCYNELSWNEKLRRCSIAFEIIYEILESNFYFNQKNFEECLLCKILWPSVQNIGFINKEINKVLIVYKLAFQLGESNFRLIKIISKLVNLVGELIRNFDKCEEIKYPYFGTKSTNFARELSIGLSEYFENFGETSELILSLKRPWLRLLFCSFLLNFLTGYQCYPELVQVCDILEHLASNENKSKVQPNPEDCDSSVDGKVVRRLKKLKSINGKNANGETPLHVACDKNNSEEVKALLTFPELDVNETDISGWTALHLAAYKGHVSCVEELLKFHPKNSLQKPVNTRARGPDNTTPIMCGVSQGHTEVCRLLLDHSGSVILEDINESNQTALELTDHPEIIKILKHYRNNYVTATQKNNTIDIRQEYKESVSRICVELIQAYFSTHRTWDVYKKLKKLKENNSEEMPTAVEVVSAWDYIRYHRDIKTNICKLRKLVMRLEEVKDFSRSFHFYTEILNSNK